MTMHKVLYPRDDVDRLYVSRKEGGREHARIEDSVDISIQRLEDYIEKTRRRTDYGHQEEYWYKIDHKMTKTRKQKLGGKTTTCAF